MDEWLRELLPAAFKTVCEPVQDEELEYSWRLLKSNCSHHSFHRELPDGVDLISAKGRKSKGWQDSKLYFGMFPYYQLFNLLFICRSVTRLPIPDAMRKKEKAKAKCTAGKHHIIVRVQSTEYTLH